MSPLVSPRFVWLLVALSALGCSGGVSTSAKAPFAADAGSDDGQTGSTASDPGDPAAGDAHVPGSRAEAGVRDDAAVQAADGGGAGPDGGAAIPCEQPTVVDEGPLASLGACGKLVYGRYAARGESEATNIIPDFSYAGYHGGGVALPEVATVVTISAGTGDDRARIQAAIDMVSARKPDAAGMRGAVLLRAGHYEVGDTLHVTAGGVVIRGEGQGADGTVLTATAAKQYSLISFEGTRSYSEVKGTRRAVTDTFVPVGTRTLHVEQVDGLSVGDVIGVVRSANQAWIDALGMAPYGWTGEGYSIDHLRTIRAIEGTTLTVDMPLVDALHESFGGGAVFRADTAGRLREGGVEDIRLESTFASETDENHGWIAVNLSATENCWVRRMTARYFGYSAVQIIGGGSFTTVEEVAMLDPKSQITGGRRYPFAVQDGQGNLFQRCYAREGRHNFVSGSQVTGPNVWLDCLAENAHADDGPHHRWATGLLFDNTKSAQLRVQNRADSGSGHGWAGAQVMFWNVDAETLTCDAPPHAMSWSVGAVGEVIDGQWVKAEPPGTAESAGTAVQPRSLYLAQLADRLGAQAVTRVTSAEQRAGRVWDQLRNWAGEGRLAAAKP